MGSKKNINDLSSIQGKRVLIRVDFNVPFDKKSGEITNDLRIRAALPTIRYLLENGASIIAMSHLGRPKGDPTADQFLKMDRVAARFSELLGVEVKKPSDHVIDDSVRTAAHQLQPGQVLLLENVRFDPREQKNDSEFAAQIAELADIYVNDAFGTCQNDKDASMVAVPAAMKTAGKSTVLGLLVEKELRVIDGLMENPTRPMIAVMGGAKVSDKIAFINVLLQKVDQLLIGGKMAYTFFKSLGMSVGNMTIPDEELVAAANLVPYVGKKILLPTEVMVANSGNLDDTQIVQGDLPDGYEGVDIGPATVETYRQIILNAGTVIWNGPVGWFERPKFSQGTQGIAKALADASKTTTIVGGGETAEAVEKFGYANQITHVSTGGGAFLAYVEGRKFQSLAQIEDK
ncbi:MAG: phosphoglycerate kinase [Zavarzinella sp.]